MSTFYKSITRNTILLYIRQIFIIFIAFFTQRIVLKALGVEDYGIYNVVGGLIVIIGIVNAGMIQASQRFFAYEMGRGDSSELKIMFGTSLTIHIIISIVVLLVAEVVGLWFLNTQMNIPPDRMLAANSIYQASICSLLLIICVVPFDALIISKEDFDIYAYISILEYILKFIIAYLIYSLECLDRLIIYSWLLFTVTLVSKGFSVFFAKKRYEECGFKFYKGKENVRRMLSFASFSFLGNIGFILRNQGVNIVVNIFWGTAINAARGIAYQVSSQISSFSGNFQLAATPQITKSYANGDLIRMRSLIYKSSKYSFCLLFLLALPIAIHPYPLLKFWLENPPLYSDRFLQLAIIVSLLDCMAIPLGKGIDATGRIKVFQSGICIIMCMDIPLAFLIYTMGAQCYEVMFVSIVTSLLGLIFRLIVLSYRIKLITIISYIRNVFFPCLITTVVDALAAYFLYNTLFTSDNLLLYVLYVVLVCILSVVTIYFVCLEEKEKVKINNIIRKTTCRIF